MFGRLTGAFGLSRGGFTSLRGKLFAFLFPMMESAVSARITSSHISRKYLAKFVDRSVSS
jgi:hypothetical protein